MNLRKMIETIRAYRAGAPLGDVVVLKLDALSKPPKGIAQRLEAVRGYAPEQNLSALRALPSGTLGREYARFLDANGIEPLVISAAVKERFRDNPFALRYTTTHDLHHVLTGFDTGLAGEAGNFAFSVGQGAAPGTGKLLWLTRIVYSILSPSQARKIWHNIRVGRQLGRKAKLLIAQPIESYFEEPLGQVRARLGIPDPAAAGVLASGSSLVADALYKRKAPGRVSPTSP
jgi:ubiquinone biosynthesis protein Coq4